MVHNKFKLGVFNYHQTLILLYLIHQSITYGITKHIHIATMSKLIIINALLDRIFLAALTCNFYLYHTYQNFDHSTRSR
jgi:hypothetical protein